ncbi:glycosyl hydrolase family 28 protein [Paenibacillus sp. G2S3]|uniref:glycosyl hydrolase family 28 protein n=1 Tax=Paenibacillus sp. G2S3 TaxID=3047872 RepID=UPI0024C2039B|nr:glycosyl hydrolase family 28 protein [Paenibacillus sp. G2S3]WHY17195.1 glycosyl hydrolase family 28 protein [Paenibacillus sp. G2S3]
MRYAQKLSIEINGDIFRNLHLFANPMEKDAPQPEDANVLVVQPGIHRKPDLLRLLGGITANPDENRKVLYFAPGTHYIEETVIPVPSETMVYLAGGSALVGSLVCEGVHDVTIRGRGVIYLADFQRYSAFRGVRIIFSQSIKLEGITVIDPPHYSIFIGQSEGIEIDNFKSFSTRGWSDGIDIMSSSEVRINDVFMRNSDDCIAIYGSRWDFYGDTRNISVTDSMLWADVAHPLMIGTHGDHERNGDIIESIVFANIDILNHHEPQENYWGALAINAGDRNQVCNVLYENIRVERIEQGQLFDVRVVYNKDYNPEPGTSIRDITFRNVSYTGKTNPSRIYGYDEERAVENVTFVNLRVNGELVDAPRPELMDINHFAKNINFVTEKTTVFYLALIIFSIF